MIAWKLLLRYKPTTTETLSKTTLCKLVKPSYDPIFSRWPAHMPWFFFQTIDYYQYYF